MDLKNAPGSSGSGEPTAATDVTFSLSDADFHKLFEGKKHFVFSYLTSLHFCHYIAIHFFWQNVCYFHFAGKLNPTSAFMSGKLKMEGNLGKAMALEKVMKKMNSRGYHTSTSSTYTNNKKNLNNFGKQFDIIKSKLWLHHFCIIPLYFIFVVAHLIH